MQIRLIQTGPAPARAQPREPGDKTAIRPAAPMTRNSGPGPDRDQAIINLWAEGKTQTQIGHALRISKAAVSGRINRLRRLGHVLAERGSPVQRVQAARKAAPPAATVPPSGRSTWALT